MCYAPHHKERLDIGVGRGSIYNEYEYTGYGLRSHDSRTRMDEAMEIMTRAWHVLDRAHLRIHAQHRLVKTFAVVRAIGAQRLEGRLQRCEALDGRARARVLVVIQHDRARLVFDRHDAGREPPRLQRRRCPGLAHDCMGYSGRFSPGKTLE